MRFNILVRILVFFFLAWSLFIGTAHSQKTFDITKYGAVGDGRTDDSLAFVKAWGDICNGDNDGVLTLLVPEGKTFMLQPIKFEGPCKPKSPHIQVLGTVLAPNRGAWKECESGSWLSFSNVENLMLDGSGKIDGQGSAWWSTTQYDARSRKLLADNDNCKPQKALEFHNCLNLKLSGLTFLNSPQAHIGINGCDNTDVSHLNIHAPEKSPNTDGIDISFSSHVSIRDSFIGTGDDCIAINGGCSFLYITNIACGPGHGISVGSLGADGATEKVDNIYVKDCSFTRTTNGARIKTWQGGSGYARNITFERIKLDGAQNPIIIDQYYCNGDQNCRSQSSAVVVGDVTYINFEGTSATEEAIKFDCDKISGGCHNIVMDQINIKSSVGDKMIFASCNNAEGTSVGTTVPNVPCLKSSGTEPATPAEPATPKTKIFPPPTPINPPPLPIMPPPLSPAPIVPLPSPPPPEPTLAPIILPPSPPAKPIIPPPSSPFVPIMPPPLPPAPIVPLPSPPPPVPTPAPIIPPPSPPAKPIMPLLPPPPKEIIPPPPPPEPILSPPLPPIEPSTPPPPAAIIPLPPNAISPLPSPPAPQADGQLDITGAPREGDEPDTYPWGTDNFTSSGASDDAKLDIMSYLFYPLMVYLLQQLFF